MPQALRLDFRPPSGAAFARRRGVIGIETGGEILAKYIRLGALLALCVLVSGCDPCGGPLKFNKFPGACNYDQAK
jgi:hypothetical protein